ncbi:TPA: hypothetical protein ACH3X3_001043 [Trebouxia sp. C0006]
MRRVQTWTIQDGKDKNPRHGSDSRYLVKRAIYGCSLMIVFDCFFDPNDANIQLARMASTASMICIFFKLVSTLRKS